MDCRGATRPRNDDGMIQLPGPFWMIGCGNMAGAMLEGWLAAGLDPRQVTVIRPSGTPAPGGVRTLAALPAGETPAIAMLGVKPQKLDDVAPGLAPVLAPETILVSILAGVEIASLRDRFPTPHAIVRAMPNTPVALRKGATGLFSDSADTGARDTLGGLMSALGHAEWVEDEDLLHVVGALCGSGPAFVFRFIDAMAAAGAVLGLPPEQAARLALATVDGAGSLAASSAETPHELAVRVTSPGGMTAQGLDVLDENAAFADLVRRTLAAAVDRSREMAAAARR